MIITPSRHRLAALVGAVMLTASAAVVAAPPAAADEVRSSEWYLSALGIEKAWSSTKGRNVRIGIVDTGVDGSIPDLRGAVVAGKDFSGHGSPDGQRPVLGARHGTNVASLAAGRGHGAGAGLVGSAPEAQIVTASVALDAASNTGFSEAIKWLVGQHVKVISMSFSGAGSDVVSAIEYAEAHDVVLVASTGDVFKADFRPGYPALFPGVVGVTGVDRNLKLDPAATTGRGTAIAGPFSTAPSARNTGDTAKGLNVANPRNSPFGAYSTSVGTSLSAPIVAGVVALIRAAHPELDAANVVNRLLKTATPAGGPVPNLSYGYGIVNADRAVHAHVPTVTANPLGSLVPGGGTPTTTPPASSVPPASSAPPSGPSSAPTRTTSAPPEATTSGSSGLGAGVWVAVVAAVLIAVGLIAWLLGRGRNRR